MRPVERNPTFTNLLADSPSPYLRQHAHNPVFWYPWGREAIERARAENKVIFLSIGYSSCYWCHVMEREVFENLSMAALMNRSFINIKVDREEHPELDEIYMIARQLLKNEGGWPNSVFLTPELKPFYAGGTYFPDESPGRPSFPRLLEWVNHVWENNRDEVLTIADNLTTNMQPYLIYRTPENAADAIAPAEKLFALYKKYYDSRAGGFFQAPKFPHECYLQFLLGTGKKEALDMVTHSLAKMAAGGIQDHVGCGFHRYAIDKEWYIPHFEKMLYNQAQLARLYTDAANLTGNPYFADVARSILDFVGGPLTSGNGAFYAAIDAETEGVEGAHYAWKQEELATILTSEELLFLTTFYALADIPKFPGHKHVDGQVLIARKSLDEAAKERKIPYTQLAAMSGKIMNKLLEFRNKRQAPRIDDKILVSWNGLMIDAFANAGKVLNRPSYTARAREAVDFLLENAIDNEGNLKRIYAGGRAYLDATLDDYAFLIKGLLSLWRATPDDDLLDSAKSLTARAEELFGDNGQGYFYSQSSDYLLFRVKNGDDSAMPNANATMTHNLIDLYEITNEPIYLDQAKAITAFFLNGNKSVSVEFATMVHATLRLQSSPSPLVGEGGEGGNSQHAQSSKSLIESPLPNPPPQEGRESDSAVIITAALSPIQGTECELLITLDIKPGWHINPAKVTEPFLIPTQIDIQGAEVITIAYPEAEHYEGRITILARIRLHYGEKRPIKVMIRFQPCQGTSCGPIRDISLIL